LGFWTNLFHLFHQNTYHDPFLTVTSLPWPFFFSRPFSRPLSSSIQGDSQLECGGQRFKREKKTRKRKQEKENKKTRKEKEERDQDDV
jgi:hypothetical protein